jgi:hypothetical protein
MEVHDVLNVFVFGTRNKEFLDFILLNFNFSIVRAFLIEEQRIVAMVMKSKKGTGATETPAPVTAQPTSQKSK